MPLTPADLGALTIDEGVVVETANGVSVFWLPGEADRTWDRVGGIPHAAVVRERGVCFSRAGLTPTRRRGPDRLGAFVRRLTWADHARTWTRPGGEKVEQCGPRRSDVLFAWAEGEATPLEEDEVRTRWPDCRSVRAIGRNLFLVEGVVPDRPPPPATRASGATPRQLAERVLADARASGDPGRVAAALVDLGLASLKGGDVRHAVRVFEDALAAVRPLGDAAREADVLCGLGQALSFGGRPGPARDALRRAVALAQSAGDRYAEKAALDHLGQALAALGDPDGAVAAFDRALALAAALGDRQHEADLLWLTAVRHAEAGRRDKAATYALWSVDLLRRLGKPQAEWYARHLARFHASAPGVTLPTPAGPFLNASVDTSAAAPRPEPGPGLLRMARTATEAMVKFVGSGFRTTSEAVYRERLAICSTCEHHTGLRCRVCGCFTAAKAKPAHEGCPTGRWPR